MQIFTLIVSIALILDMLVTVKLMRPIVYCKYKFMIPVSPASPFKPLLPSFPLGPTFPFPPMFPGGPLSPVKPLGPGWPLSPGSPGGPTCSGMCILIQ